MDTRQNADIFASFHAFLQQYWSPDRMGMRANSFQEMLNNTTNVLQSSGITSWIPGLSSQIDQAKELISSGALSQISSIFDNKLGNM